MAKQPTPLTATLFQYLLATSVRESPELAGLREETDRHPRSAMQICPDQGQFMALLVRLMGARRCLEVGTFTGYSAAVVAAALPAGGRVLTCDVSEEFTARARVWWARAGVDDRISLELGPAAHTLERLVDAGEAGTWDFAFIDADKVSYDRYYELCLTLVRPGGLILIDNTFWDGAVADPAADDADTQAIRALNLKLRDDPRVDLAQVPVGDGLTLVLKRSAEAG